MDFFEEGADRDFLVDEIATLLRTIGGATGRNADEYAQKLYESGVDTLGSAAELNQTEVLEIFFSSHNLSTTNARKIANVMRRYPEVTAIRAKLGCNQDEDVDRCSPSSEERSDSLYAGPHDATMEGKQYEHEDSSNSNGNICPKCQGSLISANNNRRMRKKTTRRGSTCSETDTDAAQINVEASQLEASQKSSQLDFNMEEASFALAAAAGLPFDPDSAACTAEAEPLLTALVVDDSRLDQATATKMLTQVGFSVSTAANGSEGLKAMCARRFTLVLLDVCMPVMDGFQCATLFRAWEMVYRDEQPRQFVCCVTGNEDVTSSQCMAIGMDDVITKPYGAGKLRACCTRILQSWVGPSKPLLIRHALVVDDDEGELCKATGLLRHLGYEVSVAKDGREALRMMQCRTFSVVFLDYQMPELNGIECASMFREWECQHRPGCRQFVCCVTESVDQVTSKQFMEQGMDEVIVKPYNAGKLQAVDAHLVVAAASIPPSVPLSLSALTAANSMSKQVPQQAEQPEISMMMQASAFLGVA